MLNLSSGIDDMGEIRWQLVLCFLLAWILVFLCICKGVKSVGKVGEECIQPVLLETRGEVSELRILSLIHFKNMISILIP